MNNNLNLPNILAFFRLVLAPLMFFMLLQVGGQVDATRISWLNYFAALIFLVASITDFFDGFIARRWNQMTKLGSILDPLADKMLIIASLLGLMMIGRAEVWAVYLIFVRDFFITGFRVFLAAENVDVRASFSGKLKTVAQMFAIGFLTMQWPFGHELLWLSVVLSLYSGVEYIAAYIKNPENRGRGLLANATGVGLKNKEGSK